MTHSAHCAPYPARAVPPTFSPQYIPAVTNGYNHLSPDILAVRFSAIGDILLTTPLLRAIRLRHPGARIAVLTKRQYVPLLSDNPYLNEVFGMAEDERIGQVAEQIRSSVGKSCREWSRNSGGFMTYSGDCWISLAPSKAT